MVANFGGQTISRRSGFNGDAVIDQMDSPSGMVSGGVNLKNVTEYVEIGVTGICLGSAYLGTLLAQGKKPFVREIQQFVKLVAKARAQKLPTKKKKP